MIIERNGWGFYMISDRLFHMERFCLEKKYAIYIHIK